MIYLLDLNHTLVGNSRTKVRPFTMQIAQEVYRDWLVELLRAEYVILMTARPAIHARQTLESIRAKTLWEPQEAYFNAHDLAPPDAKARMLAECVFPNHGSKPADFHALESNPKTRAMYARHGIQAVKVTDTAWTRLPR